MAGSLTAFEMNLEPATTSFEERAKSATLGANDAAVGVIAAEK